MNHADDARPILGLDLDGVITEYPKIFQALTHSWPGPVLVITYRDDSEQAKKDAEACGIRFDELILVSSFEEKGRVVRERGVAMYFDDQPEMLVGMPETTAIGLIRNAGNFDFEQDRWIMSNKTARLV